MRLRGWVMVTELGSVTSALRRVGATPLENPGFGMGKGQLEFGCGSLFQQGENRRWRLREALAG